MALEIEITRMPGGRWAWFARSRNGRVVAISFRGWAKKSRARRAWHSFQRHVYQGEWHWRKE